MMRDFDPDDQVAVRQLVLDGLKERWGEVFDPSYNDDLDDIASTYVDRGAEVVVLELDGSIVATGTLLDQGDQRGRILRMSVAQSHRRRGLARQIVHELIDRASARGLAAIDVSTDTPWASAVALYAACGFGEVGRDATDTHFVLDLSACDEQPR